MTAAAKYFSKKKPVSSNSKPLRQPIEIVQIIQSGLEKPEAESYSIGKRVEDLLARVYFSSVN